MNNTRTTSAPRPKFEYIEEDVTDAGLAGMGVGEGYVRRTGSGSGVGPVGDETGSGLMVIVLKDSVAVAVGRIAVGGSVSLRIFRSGMTIS